MRHTLSAPCKLCSLLLQYPSTELVAAHEELAEATASVPEASALVEHIAGTPLPRLQEEYVRTFDFDRRASLHLTYHAHGDRRQRGLELVRLKRRFAGAGLALGEEELPDYLPVLLEFAALAPEHGEPLLAELREPIELVRARLHETESRYAGVLDAIVRRLPKLTPAQAEAIRRLALEGPPSELVGLEPFGAEAALVPEGAR
jgi:nitrate reductase delta subunit